MTITELYKLFLIEQEFRNNSPKTIIWYKEQLIDFCVEHMANENWSAEQVRAHMEAVIPKLNHWK